VSLEGTFNYVEIDITQFHKWLKPLSLELYAELLAEKKVRERLREEE
jgi:hypothetical protein